MQSVESTQPRGPMARWAETPWAHSGSRLCLPVVGLEQVTARDSWEPRGRGRSLRQGLLGPKDPGLLGGGQPPRTLCCPSLGRQARPLGVLRAQHGLDPRAGPGGLG